MFGFLRKGDVDVMRRVGAVRKQLSNWRSDQAKAQAGAVGEDVMREQAALARERAEVVREDLRAQMVGAFTAYDATIRYARERLKTVTDPKARREILEDLQQVRTTTERGLQAAIRGAYSEQMRLGKRAGWNWRDLDKAESRSIMRLRREEYAFVTRFLDDIGADRLKMPVERRAALYGNAGLEAFWQGFLYADQSSGRYLQWVNDEAEHCFPAGTTISTPSGPQAIESIRLGDVVDTLEGPRRVTRLYQRETRHDLVAVTAGGKRTACTPNHPFLTRRGWVAAGDLCRGDEVMLHEDGFHKVFVEVALPDSDNAVAECTEGAVASCISRLLRLLPFRQRLVTRVSMPVVAVDLNDEVLDANIDDEARQNAFSDRVRHSKAIQSVVQSLFKLRGVLTLMPRFAGHERFENLVNVLSLPRKRFRTAFWIIHRVVLPHALGALVVNNASGGLISQGKAQFVGFVADSNVVSRKRLGNRLCSLIRVMLGEVRDILVGPRAHRTGLVEGKTGSACSLCAPRPVVATDRTDETRAPARGLFLAKLPITASGIAVVPRLLPTWWNVAVRGLPAVSTVNIEHVAALIALHRGTPPHCEDTTTRTGTQVYNLEVEGAHHYVANGFVVHNCNDCLFLAGNLPPQELKKYRNPNPDLEHGGRWGVGVYTAQELARLAIVPQSGELRCTTNCKCRLVDVERPPGKPSGPLQRQPFQSLAPKPVGEKYEKKRAPYRTRRVKRDGKLERGGGLKKALLALIRYDLRRRRR